jgi:hypothetical protein
MPESMTPRLFEAADLRHGLSVCGAPAVIQCPVGDGTI